MFPSFVECIGGDDGGGGVGHHQRIEDVRRGQNLEIGRVGTDGGDRAFVDDRLNLDDEGAESVDVERVDRAQGRQMAFEHRHHPLPDSASVRCPGRDEGP